MRGNYEHGKWVASYADPTATSLFTRTSTFEDENGAKGYEVEVTEVLNLLDCGDDLAGENGPYNVTCSSWGFDGDTPREQILKIASDCGASSDWVLEHSFEKLTDDEALRFAELRKLAQWDPAKLEAMPTRGLPGKWADGEHTRYEAYNAAAIAWEEDLYTLYRAMDPALRAETLHSYYGGDEPSYRSCFPSLREAMRYEDIPLEAISDDLDYAARVADDAPLGWGKECDLVRVEIWPRERHVTHIAAATGQAIIRHEFHTAGKLLRHLRAQLDKMDADLGWNEKLSDRLDWYEGADTLAALVGYAQLVPEDEL